MRDKARRGDIRSRIDSLPTSRLATQQERAVLAVLRSKAPRRALSPAEAALVAEWQATELLELAGLTGPPTPATLISELPRVLVRTDVDLPVSGCTAWTAGRWLIVLNGAEPLARQRFSLAHEFKHAIDHRYRDVLYVDRPKQTAYAQAEQAADYFAACLLMPRRWIKRAWADGHQRGSDLSDLFQVSAPAMSRRLAHLGLGTTPGTTAANDRQSPTYERLKHPWSRSRV
jgi:Zn-dependent peptidase ImmA (M78 family)